MATVDEITQALFDVVAALPEVDAADLNSYLPAVETRRVALVAVPTGASGDIRYTTLDGGCDAGHQVRLQLWVKFVQGDAGDCLRLAREIGFQAAKALMDADGTGYELDVEATGGPLRWETAPDVLSVAEIPYLMVTLTARVWHAV